jgi:hypothetical protein
LAARAAAAIKKEFGVEVETVVGDRGEFTVWVNGEKVLGKGVLLLPSEKKIVATVRPKLSTGSG